jgi:hypothetical protein
MASRRRKIFKRLWKQSMPFLSKFSESMQRMSNVMSNSTILLDRTTEKAAILDGVSL